MDLIQNYSSSDEDDDHDSLIENRFAQVPLRYSHRSEGGPAHKTFYARIPIRCNGQIKQIGKLAWEHIVKEIPGISIKHIDSKNYHISLSYNIDIVGDHKSNVNEHYDAFFRKLEDQVRTIQIGNSITFSKELIFLPSVNTNKVFMALKLDDETCDQLRPIVNSIERSMDTLFHYRNYDTSSFHVSLAEISGLEETLSLLLKRIIPISERVSASIDSIEVSDGRSMRTIHI